MGAPCCECCGVSDVTDDVNMLGTGPDMEDRPLEDVAVVEDLRDESEEAALEVGEGEGEGEDETDMLL